MPSANVHLLVAGELLEEWAGTPASAPFPVRDPGCREAFLHGSLAPDAGFIPGNARLPSELAHYWGSGDLTRALLSGSETDAQVAFAWGWASHALADAALHPLVGRTCGELVHGDRDRRMDAAEDEATHVSVETGLDILVQRREGPRLLRPPSRPFFDENSIGLLTDALEDTYGIAFPDPDLLTWHRRGVRALRLWRPTLGILVGSTGMGPGGVGVFRRLLTRAFTFLPRLRAVSGSAAQGLLHPRRPTAWLLRRVYRTVGDLRREVRFHVETEMARLENRNLETGLLEGAVPHAYGDRALERLHTLRDTRGAPSSEKAPAGRPDHSLAGTSPR